MFHYLTFMKIPPSFHRSPFLNFLSTCFNLISSKSSYHLQSNFSTSSDTIFRKKNENFCTKSFPILNVLPALSFFLVAFHVRGNPKWFTLWNIEGKDLFAEAYSLATVWRSQVLLHYNYELTRFFGTHSTDTVAECRAAHLLIIPLQFSYLKTSHSKNIWVGKFLARQKKGVQVDCKILAR
jgi:hypothetical protein